MRLFIYVSLYCGSQVDQDIQDIVSVSKQRNPDEGITGVLLFHNGHFVQVLEGSEAAVENLIARLQADPRHRELQPLVDIPISKRLFAAWNMDTLNLDKAELFNTASLIKLRDAYSRNVEISDANFICLLQDMLNTPGVEEILNR